MKEFLARRVLTYHNGTRYSKIDKNLSVVCCITTEPIIKHIIRYITNTNSK